MQPLRNRTRLGHLSALWRRARAGAALGGLTLGGLTLTGLLGGCSEQAAECVTDPACGDGRTCLQGTCVGAEVAGDPRALYDEEFRLRLEMECGLCHHDGYEGSGVVPDDGRWRLYRGAFLRAQRVEDSWLDLQQWIGGSTPERTPLVAFALGAAGHPIVWADPPVTVSQRRVINWLWLFEGRGPRPDLGVDAGPPQDLGPRPDGGPPPDGGPVDGGPPEDLGPRPDGTPPPDQGPPAPDQARFVNEVHAVLVGNCNGCHGGAPNPGDGFFRLSQADANATYRDVLDFVDVGNPTASRILARPAGGDGHLLIWNPGDAPYETVLNWIRGR